MSDSRIAAALAAALCIAATSAAQEPVPPERRPGQFYPPAPSEWVAFSAELEVFTAGRPPQYGRHFQDEHGCQRREIPDADGRLVITIRNELTNTTYRFADGQWTAQSMRPGPERRRPITRMALDGRAPFFEGFDAYILQRPSLPEGFRRESIVIPALNFFEPSVERPNQPVLTARNIVVGPQDQDLFHPPANAKVTPIEGIGGSMTFSAVVISVTFPGQPARELTTSEERPYEFTTPEGRTYHLVTTVTNWDTNEVRVRLMRDPKGFPWKLTGEVLDEVQAVLGGTAATTKMPENFQLRITRIRDRRAR
jgi:hypothetical protein